ncbi:MAG: AAA family ATPase [Planctomycetota bacterium]
MINGINEPMMGLKLAISGKGGVGKSTFAAMFAHFAVQDGWRVLAIDADPAANLAACLGMSADERRRIVPLAERRALIEERTGAKVKQYGQIFKLNPEVADIAAKESAQFRNIHLLVLGAIERGGSGCACPESVILKALLTDVILFKDDCVIMDLEAGLEHLGRATAKGVDLMLVIVEPGSRAVETANMIKRMAGEIGISRLAIIGNKIVNADDEEFLKNAFRDSRYLGSLLYDDTIRRADRESLPLIDIAPPALRQSFQTLWQQIIS